jgi:hypothetical protein
VRGEPGRGAGGGRPPAGVLCRPVRDRPEPGGVVRRRPPPATPRGADVIQVSDQREPDSTRPENLSDRYARFSPHPRTLSGQDFPRPAQRPRNPCGTPRPDPPPSGGAPRTRPATLRPPAPVAQPAEAGPLKGSQCGFEPHRGHSACGPRRDVSYGRTTRIPPACTSVGASPGAAAAVHDRQRTGRCHARRVLPRPRPTRHRRVRPRSPVGGRAWPGRRRHRGGRRRRGWSAHRSTLPGRRPAGRRRGGCRRAGSG